MSATMSPSKPETSSVMVYLQPGVKRRFQELCAANGQTMSGVLAAFIEDMLRRHSPTQGGERR